MSGGIQPYSQLVFGAHFCEKKTFDDLASPWWLGGIWEYAEPFCLGVQVTLAMHGEVFFVISVFFLHLFEGPFPIYLTQREIWKVVEMFFLSLKIATLFSITYPYLLGNQFYNTQTAVSLEPTCGVLFISWGKQTLNMAWTFGVSEWWSQSFSDIFFWGNQTGCILECQFFQIMGTMSGSSGLLVFYSNVVTFGTHLKRISWLVNLHLPGHVTPYWNKV